eukprot:gnl/MRDRNA2_/MRDRNA2_87795_c0_seq1.p1 gnl/MRDRNA2_/MRDRNA2_87795_c0~~gnl/MRDRNA2_/MRDRNA2_87795_c0_seq1.p1  ORF type:complete len:460 (+),score=202.25 gnl/MRDRNA2_/MRDRNA2_87795_c0_seq1:72-1451(+)
MADAEGAPPPAEAEAPAESAPEGEEAAAAPAEAEAADAAPAEGAPAEGAEEGAPPEAAEDGAPADEAAEEAPGEEAPEEAAAADEAPAEEEEAEGPEPEELDEDELGGQDEDDMGADDDLGRGDGDLGDEEEDEGFDDQEDALDPMQELKDKYEELLEQNERLQQDNVALQRRVIQWKAQKDKYDAEKPSEGKVTEHKYLMVLGHVHSVRLRLRQLQVKEARMSEELKNQLEEKRAKAIECRDSFRDFKRQVARHAEYSRTGKKIPLKIIQEVEDFELDKDAEVEEVRGSNISLKNRLAKLEQALRKKDELAENLHVIDFEQLKIENQTLNEKIEERNEELHKLRKKTIITVQVITHMREKLQFIQQENQVLRKDLAELDTELASQRDLVAKTKHERDDYRSENAKLRQQTGIINSELLTKDYEDRTQHIKKLKEELDVLKAKHKKLMKFIKAHNQSGV